MIVRIFRRQPLSWLTKGQRSSQPPQPETQQTIRSAATSVCLRQAARRRVALIAKPNVSVIAMLPFHTAPVLQDRDRGRALFIALSGCALCMASLSAPTAETLVVTDGQYPVHVEPAVRLIELDAPARLVRRNLSRHLPADLERASTIARKRLMDGGVVLHNDFSVTYQGIVEAWILGITKIPAVVVDRRYVVYGQRDVNRAVALIEEYRSAQQ